MTNKQLPAAFLAAILAGIVPAQQASSQPDSAFQWALQRHMMRLRGVDLYVERIAANEIPGMYAVDPEIYGPQQAGGCIGGNCVVYKVEQVSNPDGTTTPQPRALSKLEVQELAGLSPGADFVELLGAGLIDAQGILNQQMGWTAGPMETGSGDAANAFFAPWNFFAAGGAMMLRGARGIREAEKSLATSAEQAQQEADTARRALAPVVEEVGQETTPEGRTGTRYAASGLNTEMPMANNQPVYMNAVSILIDPNDFVILGHRIEGTMVGEGESRPFFVEVENSDFRNVDGCDLYEPYRRTMRMGGMLDDEQMAEMEEARAQLAEFEAQMAGMPPAQRQMMESMIGPQMQTIRTMANGGAFEYTQEIEEIICNPDLAALFSVPGATSAGELIDPVELLARIQMDLVTLGYQPGNTNGIMDTLTEIAISQYQAERGLEVTGQPTGALAAVLAREAGGQG